MRKSTLIISAILTAALLFTLYSLLSAYQKAIQAAVPSTAKVSVSAENSQGQSTGIAADNSTAGKIAIYDAATLAIKVLGRSDLYTTENTQLNGVDVYLATFASGDIIYISLDGQVLSKSKVDGLSIRQPTSHR
jgi:hypothetical protein